MGWYKGEHCKSIEKSTCEALREVKGRISAEESRRWFVKYCISNLYFTVKLLLGVKLAPIQEIILKSFFQRDYSLQVAGRGFSKSFLISIFIIVY